MNKEVNQLKLQFCDETLREAGENNNCTIGGYEYLEYIKKIINHSSDKIIDARGRELRKFPYNSSYILVRFLKEGDLYLDGIEYQRYDNVLYTLPLGFVYTSPYEFVKSYLNENEKDFNLKIFSMREFKKIKATRYFNKENLAFWIDEDGYFYCANKCLLPNKASNQEYNQFYGNDQAVLVKGTRPLNREDYIEWFLSESEFLKFFNEILKETPTSFAAPEYKILQRGYAKQHPLDQKNISRLPYLNLEQELGKCMIDNEYYRIDEVSHIWLSMINKSSNSKNFDYMDSEKDLIQKIIKEYISYNASVKK